MDGKRAAPAINFVPAQDSKRQKLGYNGRSDDKEKPLDSKTSSRAPTSPSRNASPNETKVPLDKKDLRQRIAEAKARVEQKLKSAASAFTSTATVHPSLVVDSNTGNVDIRPDAEASSRPKIQYGAKANVRAANRADQHSLNQKQSLKKGAASSTDATLQNPYLEHHISMKNVSANQEMPNLRLPKGFHFVPQGKYVAEGTKLRNQIQLEKLRAQIEKSARAAGLDAELDLVGDGAVKHGEIPDIEWWDQVFLPKSTYDDPEALEALNNSPAITNLIQHPVAIEPPIDFNFSAARPLMLTKKEQKKARRLRRLESQREQQEKQRLGLVAVEQPKLRISNLMRVLGNEAVSDPTTVELSVREQMAKRVHDHQLANLARKLTPEERRTKKMQKRQEDTSKMVHVAVFRVGNLETPQHRFKVDANAKQNHLTGIGIIYSSCNLVLVEGGPLGVKRYKNLMLRRIDWKEEPLTVPSDGLNNDPTQYGGMELDSHHVPIKDNSCVLIWEGLMKNREFGGFHFKTCPSEHKARELLGTNCDHYWDMAKHADNAADSVFINK